LWNMMGAKGVGKGEAFWRGPATSQKRKTTKDLMVRIMACDSARDMWKDWAWKTRRAIRGAESEMDEVMGTAETCTMALEGQT